MRIGAQGIASFTYGGQKLPKLVTPSTKTLFMMPFGRNKKSVARGNMIQRIVYVKVSEGTKSFSSISKCHR